MFVDTKNGQIHCRVGGIGEPLLLLHGLPSSSSEFSEIIPILSQHYRILAMDLPLYGDSYKLTKEPDIKDLAQATLDFLDVLNIQKTHIGGHHTGASVAVELAAEHSHRVNKLVLSGCPALTPEQGRMLIENSPYKELKITPDGWFLQTIWDLVIKRYPPDKMDKAYEFALDYMKAGTRAEEGHRACFGYDILPKLRKIRQPTLALCGDQDVCFQYHETTLKNIPHAQSHIIKGGNSHTPRLLSQEWAQAAMTFLSANFG
jgi:pimeloyl-ACP methyl ester carboxylesterase